MEPFDIDKIIKAKLEESGDLHRKESDAAKPYVLSEVRRQITKKHELRWYHLAAAVVLLLISFTFVLIGVQKRHDREIAFLSEKINTLENNYPLQAQTAVANDFEAEVPVENTKEPESKSEGLPQQITVIEKEKIIYRTDTVYIVQTEYITRAAPPTKPEPMPEEDFVPVPESTTPTLAQNNETDDVIFFGYRNENNTQNSETVKLKIGSFGSHKN